MKRILPGLLFCLVCLMACDDDSAGVGNYCDFDGDCETGMCYTRVDPGYCTAPCDDEGSMRQCPPDTICKRIRGGPRRCLLLCEHDRHCPPNSECNRVPDSDFRACEPDD